jgi:hypothetical protein
MSATSRTVSGAVWRHGPSGIRWCECTSKTNSSPARACSHAGTSAVVGTVYEPPGEVVVDGGSALVLVVLDAAVR